ncbi:MAG: ATP:cob(I)alamin adenosyltransferase [Anaerolineaceae bacterium]
MPTRRPLARRPGYTSLLNAENVSKADPRLRAIGAIDEASASLSLAKAFLPGEPEKSALGTCQAHLSLMMAGLAGWNQADFQENLTQALDWLEALLSELENKVELPGKFLRPGRTPAEGALDLARAVVRRAERETVELAQSGIGAELPSDVLTYLNRLSSLCFLLLAAQAAGQESN